MLGCFFCGELTLGLGSRCELGHTGVTHQPVRKALRKNTNVKHRVHHWVTKDTGLKETQQGPGMQLEKDIQGTVGWRWEVQGRSAPALFSQRLIQCCSPPYFMQILLCNNLYIYECVWPELPVPIPVSPLPGVSECGRLEQAGGLATQAGQVSCEKCTESCIFNLRFCPSLLEWLNPWCRSCNTQWL